MINYTIELFQESIGLGYVFGFCLVYKYYYSLPSLKKFAVGKLTDRELFFC